MYRQYVFLQRCKRKVPAWTATSTATILAQEGNAAGLGAVGGQGAELRSAFAEDPWVEERYSVRLDQPPFLCLSHCRTLAADLPTAWTAFSSSLFVHPRAQHQLATSLGSSMSICFCVGMFDLLVVRHVVYLAR